MKTQSELISEAIALTGSQKRLGEMIGRSQQSVSFWLKESWKVSAEDAVAIEAATNGAVSKVALRPDLFEGRTA